MKKILFPFLLMFPYFVFAQRVQISSMPGQEGGMDINQLLDQIMQPYMDQLSNLNNKRTDKEIELEVWTDIRTNIDQFDRINRYMFSYESAFRDLTNTVSDPSVLGLTVTRGSEKGKHSIIVKRLASPDMFSSDPILESEQLPSSIFDVNIGEKQYTINFPGGSLTSLVDILSKSLSNDASVSLVNTGGEYRSLSIRANNMGKSATISFTGDLSTLTAAKLLTKGKADTSIVEWSTNGAPLQLSNNSYTKELVQQVLPRTYLTFSEDISVIPPAPIKERASLDNNDIALGVSALDGISLPGAQPLLGDLSTSQSNIQEQEPQTIMSLRFSDGTKHDITLQGTNNNIDLGSFSGKTLQAVNVSTRNMIASISPLTFVSTPDGELAPFNTVSKAQDALLSYDGIDLERPTNSISDLIRGTTIELRKESPDVVAIDISPNLDLIKDTITQWVLSYNSVMDLSYNATTIPREKIGKIKPLHLRKKDGDDLVEATFLSNPALLSFRASLRRLTGEPHGTSTNTYTLLDQVGIYVQRLRGAAPSDPEAVRRGLLSLDTAQLTRALETNFDEVYRLFTENNTEGGMVGAAVAASRVNNSMIGPEGYITRVNRDSGDNIRTIDRDIAKKEDEVDKVQRRERGNLMRMNQALAASKAQSESMRQRFGN
ncbi:MAG: flagellar filament capping protein FliD [Brevinema sp.]